MELQRDKKVEKMPQNKISLQLYSVRESAAADLKGCLERVAALGFDAIEPYSAHKNLADHVAYLKLTGLTAPSMHAKFIGESDEVQRKIFNAAQELGCQTVIHPSSDKAIWKSVTRVQEFAGTTNQSMRLAAEYGLEVGYHNHAVELETHFEGVPALTFYAKHLEAEVRLQIDLFWVAVAQIDPVDLVTVLRDRVGSVHLKDAHVDAHHSSADLPAQLPLGRGNIDLVGVLNLVPNATKIIEFDSFHGDLWGALAASFEYVKDLGV